MHWRFFVILPVTFADVCKRCFLDDCVKMWSFVWRVTDQLNRPSTVNRMRISQYGDDNGDVLGTSRPKLQVDNDCQVYRTHSDGDTNGIDGLASPESVYAFYPAPLPAQSPESKQMSLSREYRRQDYMQPPGSPFVFLHTIVHVL